MALTLTIGGTDFLPQYRTGSADIQDQLQNRGNTLTMGITRKSGQTAPKEGQEIIFKDGARFLFGGFITRVRPMEYGVGSFFTYEIEATDYTYVAINKHVQKNYQAMTLFDIVDDIMTNNVDAGYGLTTTHVETGPVINTVSFNHITVRKAFEKLAALTNYDWWFDFEKNLHFKQKTTDVAPATIDDVVKNHEDMNISADLSQLRNSVIVRGGREETAAFFSQSLVTDGEQREWILREKPKTMQYIKLNGVTQTQGIDPLDNDNEASFDFMFNYQEKFVRCASGTSTPTAGDTLEVSYKYEVPIIVLLENAGSILAMRALEGGDGRHSHTIVESSIKSKTEARARASQELIEYGNPLITGVFNTRTGLLGAGVYFKAGQLLTVTLPSWGIVTPTEYTIQSVRTTMVESATGIEYNYSVRFGGRLISANTFLESLASKEDPIFDTEEIDRIVAITEEMTISETVTRNPLTKSLSESATVSESISKFNTTPPFKWAPVGSNKGVWGASEWG